MSQVILLDRSRKMIEELELIKNVANGHPIYMNDILVEA